MTKEQKKLKQLNALNVALKETNDELVIEMDAEKANLDYASELLGRTTKQLNLSTDKIEYLGHERRAMDEKLQYLERTRQITADGLIIERDELLNRARRLAMRIRGLGFDVN